MTNQEKYNNPFKIPVSINQVKDKEPEIEKPTIDVDAKQTKEPTKKNKSMEDESPEIANITIKLSPKLRDKYKIKCINEKISMQNDLIQYIKRKVGK